MRAKTESKTAAHAPPAAPSGSPAANPGGLPMPAQISDGWQRQWGAGLKVMDLWLENLAKASDAQLPAASEFVARAGELQKSMLEARSPLDVWTLQCHWMMENTTRALALWKEMFEATTAANVELWGGLRGQAPGNARGETRRSN